MKPLRFLMAPILGVAIGVNVFFLSALWAQRCTCKHTNVVDTTTERTFVNMTDHPVDLWLQDLNGTGPARVTLGRASKDGGFYQRRFVVETNGTWKEFRP